MEVQKDPNFAFPIKFFITDSNTKFSPPATWNLATHLATWKFYFRPSRCYSRKKLTPTIDGAKGRSKQMASIAKPAAAFRALRTK
jgi:hypothetical protein